MTQTTMTNSDKPHKKRGRKPKGGKIISNNNEHIENIVINEPNIILHLKCCLDDIKILDHQMNKTDTNLMGTYQFNNSRIETNYNSIKNKNSNNKDFDENISDKLKQLSINLHTNNISDKKSACFWCTCDFDNPPIFIPKYELNNSYHVYGCFCSPECACAHLFNQTNLNASFKFERYHLLNHMYCKIYNYNKNIKPAPDPYHTLDKYYGNLTIQEYRHLLKNERLLLVVDKPLTRSLPEFYEDNDDNLITSNSVSSNNKFKMRRANNKPSKNEIMCNNFNIN